MPSVTATIGLPGSPTHVTVDETFVYVAHSGGDGGFGISAIEMATNQVAGYMPTGGVVTGMAVGTNLFASVASVGLVSIMQLDVLSGTAERVLDIPGTVFDLTVVTHEGADQLLYATTNPVEEQAAEMSVSNFPYRQALAVENTPDGPSVWAATTEGQIFHVPEGGRPVHNVGANLLKIDIDVDRDLWYTQQWGDPDAGTAGFLLARVRHVDDVPESVPLWELGPGAFSLDSTYAWVLAGGNVDTGVPGTLRQVERTFSPPSAVSTTTVGLAPVDVVSTGTDVWVANFGSQSLSRIAV
jgi:hypothetical protein